eukprot:5316339-Amphidinium_carterae.1
MRTDGPVTRRLCDERKQALLTMSMQGKKAKSVRALAIARDERGAEHAHRWLRDWSLHYSWALRAAFEHCTTLSLAFDASRIGCPAEETLTIASKDCLNGIAGWACPQVDSIAAVSLLVSVALLSLLRRIFHPPPPNESALTLPSAWGGLFLFECVFQTSDPSKREAVLRKL